MVSLNVSLPVELENRVREHVASGLYGSASEVIREALRLFEAYQATQASHLQALQGIFIKDWQMSGQTESVPSMFRP